MVSYKTPGVYVSEVSNFPPSVADVATAIPAFIGYTEFGAINMPVRIASLLEFHNKFGYGPVLKGNNGVLEKKDFVLYDSLRLFYENGGGVCWILPIGHYEDFVVSKASDSFKAGIKKLEEVDEVTMLLFPDAAMLLPAEILYPIQDAALAHAQKMHDRFVLLDVKVTDKGMDEDVKIFRNSVTSIAENLRFGAAYYPYLRTSYTKNFGIEHVLGYKRALCKENVIAEFIKEYIDGKKVVATENKGDAKAEKALGGSDEILKSEDKIIEFFENVDKRNVRLQSLKNKIPGYNSIVEEMVAKSSIIPPSGAIAGIISKVDRDRGVWSAPANVSISSVLGVTNFITADQQENLNVDSESGKSINAIRPFTGKGILVWGARTLEGNSNEWRYIPVRRLFNYIEESIQKSTAWAVFSPNDANTWVKIKSQIENFLTNVWKQGALAGATPESAFYVKVGLNVTMDANDINEGRLIVEIGLAAVRPAEFIVLRFAHKVQES